MADAAAASLESLVALWPVASSLSEHLPVGDLIGLARLSVTLRALLHGFEDPWGGHARGVPEAQSSRDLHIGQHGTPYWQRLKDRAPFECSSRTHTKGPTPKPCRYCSKPICDACIVRSSFARGHENTFQNRIRYFCKPCWESGNPSRSRRFPLLPFPESVQERKRYDPDDTKKDYCTCTLKDDGWICLECKDLQNWEAVVSAETHCHGQGCGGPLDADKDRRRLCLWCNKTLPRQIGGTTRHHWNQKMIEARARNAASRQADLEEYNRRRLRSMRMSRREMRGDEAVKEDPDADLPQFVRHLDTINYRSYMDESAVPTGDTVYASKRGYWRYNKEFLLKMKSRCARVSPPPGMATTRQDDDGGLRFSRNNMEKSEDWFSFGTMMPSMPQERRKEWCALKAVILELLLVQKLSYPDTRWTMQDEYDFVASVKEYRKILHLWYSQGQISHYRRGSSLERDEEEDGSPETNPDTNEDGLERIITLDSDMSSVSHGPQRPPQDARFGRTTASGGSSADDVESDANPDDSDDSNTSALRRKAQRDQAFFAHQTQTPSSPAIEASPSSSPPPHSATDATAPGTADLAGSEADLVDDDDLGPPTTADEEDPPPYNPAGWIWP